MSEYWRVYWSTRSTGGHRHGDEGFLAKEGAEKLDLLDGGSSLLDFGCGAAELLSYLAPHYATAVGVDFSSSMLVQARARLDSHGLSAVRLLEADEESVWTELTEHFDRVTAGQVVQYFTDDQLARFLEASRDRLTADGRVVLFDVIDPRLGYLFELGLLASGGTERAMGAAIAMRSLRRAVRVLGRRLRRLPPQEIGRAHHPERVRQLAGALGLSCEILWSRYYEYRYHAVLKRAPARDVERSG